LLTLGASMSDLTRDVPLLAGAMATAPGRPRTPADLADCLGPVDGWRRWRKVAGWLGMDPSRGWVRLLRGAMEPSAWRPDDLRLLANLWAGDAKTALQHLGTPSVATTHALRIAASVGGAGVLKPSLLRELAELPHGVGRRVVQELSELAGAWKRVHRGRPLPSLQSLEALRATRESLLDALLPVTLDVRQWLAARWPEPPLPGTDHISPLADLAGQEDEGVQMMSCIGHLSYLSRPVLGEGYGYHIDTADGPASVWIIRRDDGTWRVDELKGHGNGTAPSEAHRLVRNWLALHRRWAHFRAGRRNRPRGQVQPAPSVPRVIKPPPWLTRVVNEADAPF